MVFVITIGFLALVLASKFAQCIPMMGTGNEKADNIIAKIFYWIFYVCFAVLAFGGILLLMD